MRLLVTGAGGQLGADLVAAAGRAGLAVEAARRADADLADRAGLAAFLKGRDFDVLVNCAAYAATDEAEGRPDHALAVNAEAPAAMAEACAARGARFVQISTDYVFGGEPVRTRPLTEADPPAPVNVYGLTKLHGETLARLAGGDVTIFRVAALFGVAGVGGRGGNFVETMLRLGRERGALRVVGDQVTAPTATAFAAEAILAFLARGGAPGVYHCTNTGAVSWAGFARAILEGAGVAATVEDVTTADWGAPARRPAFSALDNARLAALIGPIPTWQEALAGYLRARGHA